MALNNELVQYVASEDPAFRWERIGTRSVDGGALHDIRLTSQTWQGIVWTHRLQIFVPDVATSTDWALLSVGSDYGGQRGTSQLDMEQARRAGLVSAHLYDVPNQPLFDGLREDELLAYSLTQTLDTGDMTWPLLLPMVKATVRALDTVSEVIAESGGSSPHRYVLHGASKRGWTVWLAAVVDSRVRAIVPEVYDNLNLFAQMPHQVKVWKAYSEMIEEYTEQRLQDKMRTPRGHELALLIDPYSYRKQLTLPKLLIHGLNDRYWATDALNLYWDDLSGPKHVLYAPNQGHHIGDRTSVASTHAAFIQAVQCDSCLPDISAEFDEDPRTLQVRVRAGAQAIEARLWSAESAGEDFRETAWTSTPLASTDGGLTFTGSIARPLAGCVAVVAECLLTGAEHPYSLSTQIRILSSSDS